MTLWTAFFLGVVVGAFLLSLVVWWLNGLAELD